MTIKEQKEITKKALAEFLAANRGTYYKLNVSRSNKKLQPNEKTAFIIWNLPSVITCPYRTKLCEASCYAIKAELAYPDCLPSRQRNFAESRKADFVYNMTATILDIAKGTSKKEIIVRIHESGDFYNKAYAFAWLEMRLKSSKRAILSRAAVVVTAQLVGNVGKIIKIFGVRSIKKERKTEWKD